MQIRDRLPTGARPFAAALSAAVLLAVGSPAAHAVPITHTLVPSSSLSGDVSGTLSIQLFTNLGTQNGTATAMGSLSSTPNGTIAVDWGSPSFSGDLEVPAGGVAINAPNPGTASGNANINLFGFLNVNFALDIPITNITLGVATNATAPISPNDPNAAGPYTGAFPALDLTLGATGSFSATGPFGINVVGPLNIPEAPVGAIPVSGVLSRIGGNPGIGSEIEIPINGLSLAIPPGAPTNIVTPGCEFGQTFLGCTLNVTSVNVTLTSLTFSNVNGVLRAQQIGVPIPEPTTLALLGGGLLGLVVAGRRRLHA